MTKKTEEPIPASSDETAEARLVDGVITDQMVADSRLRTDLVFGSPYSVWHEVEAS